MVLNNREELEEKMQLKGRPSRLDRKSRFRYERNTLGLSTNSRYVCTFQCLQRSVGNHGILLVSQTFLFLFWGSSAPGGSSRADAGVSAPPTREPKN